ncbi:hypothetical protein [Halorussus salinisoli]|uniref:hypothetical protein n=1 Tax=Halorussus salinisoli TaxID=2558242 RepID=UPI0010C17F3C|nr:hypothetical protein [Halorussus salinisoli]
MNRRRLLAVGGSALAASVSGCLSSVPLVGGPPEVREKSGESLDRSVPPAVTDLSADSTVTTLVVGRGSNPHQVWVWNETGETQELAIEIGKPDAAPWVRRSYDFGADANLAIDLRDARRYAVTVWVGGRERTVEIPEARFDCNDSATDVLVRGDEMETTGITTDMGCGGLW